VQQRDGPELQGEQQLPTEPAQQLAQQEKHAATGELSPAAAMAQTATLGVELGTIHREMPIIQPVLTAQLPIVKIPHEEFFAGCSNVDVSMRDAADFTSSFINGSVGPLDNKEYDWNKEGGGES
jgi:hypothetical protein